MIFGFLLFALLLPGVYETKRLRAEYARTVLSNRIVRVKRPFFFGLGRSFLWACPA